MKPAFCYVYVLFSLKDSKFYIGYSENLKQRIIEHESGHVKSTKFRRPFKLIHYEAFSNIKDGKMRERFLKSGFGREQLRQALKNELDNLNITF